MIKVKWQKKLFDESGVFDKPSPRPKNNNSSWSRSNPIVAYQYQQLQKQQQQKLYQTEQQQQNVNSSSSKIVQQSLQNHVQLSNDYLEKQNQQKIINENLRRQQQKEYLAQQEQISATERLENMAKKAKFERNLDEIENNVNVDVGQDDNTQGQIPIPLSRRPMVQNNGLELQTGGNGVDYRRQFMENFQAQQNQLENQQRQNFQQLQQLQQQQQFQQNQQNIQNLQNLQNLQNQQNNARHIAYKRPYPHLDGHFSFSESEEEIDEEIESEEEISSDSSNGTSDEEDNR